MLQLVDIKTKFHGLFAWSAPEGLVDNITGARM